RLALIAQREKDSIAKVMEIERLKIAEQKRLDSIAKAKELQRLAFLEKKRKDSIAKAQEENRLALLAQRKMDSVILEREQQQKKLQELKSQQYLAKVKAEREQLEEEQKNNSENQNPVSESKKEKPPEKITSDNSCKYLINEYDDFYKIKTIQTDPYGLSEKLTIELYRYGKKLNVFFNLDESLGCASYMTHNRSSVKVHLENNQVVTFYHSWGVECGDFHFKGRLSDFHIKQLQSSPIASILLRGTKSTVEITNITYKDFFIDKLQCLELED
ncbi:hypothetical protein WJN01_13445, partial [Flavobacteriaceae bacterium SZ-1-7]|uniref:hypothetical protein n=1 Tax=Tamlana sedimenti TaxID=3134126 RepID=UPI00312889E3